MCDYRVMTLDGGMTYGFHEVYCEDSSFLPVMYNVNARLPHDESVVTAALERPVLTPKDFSRLKTHEHDQFEMPAPRSVSSDVDHDREYMF